MNVQYQNLNYLGNPVQELIRHRFLHSYLEYIYQIKNLDREKRRFAKDTKLSKKYENVLEDKLKKWAQMLNINTEGL